MATTKRRQRKSPIPPNHVAKSIVLSVEAEQAIAQRAAESQRSWTAEVRAILYRELGLEGTR